MGLRYRDEADSHDRQESAFPGFDQVAQAEPSSTDRIRTSKTLFAQERKVLLTGLGMAVTIFLLLVALAAMASGVRHTPSRYFGPSHTTMTINGLPLDASQLGRRPSSEEVAQWLDKIDSTMTPSLSTKPIPRDRQHELELDVSAGNHTAPELRNVGVDVSVNRGSLSSSSSYDGALPYLNGKDPIVENILRMERVHKLQEIIWQLPDLR